MTDNGIQLSMVPVPDPFGTIEWPDDVPVNAPRKRTVFAWCDNHAFLRRESRYRQAEWTCEGGVAGHGPCSPVPCNVKAGTDFFVADVCHGDYPLERA